MLRDARSGLNRVVTDARFFIISLFSIDYRTCYGRSLGLGEKAAIIGQSPENLLSIKEMPYDSKIPYPSRTSSHCTQTV